MKIKIKLALQALGVVMILWGTIPLLLLLFGTTTTGVLERIDGKSVTTEMMHQRRSVQKPTGKFLVETHVAYRFDVPATVEERLRRASDAPIRTGVTGEDVLYGKTARPDFTSHEAGDGQKVIFLRAYPAFNAAYQPNSMRTLGVMRILGALVLFAVAWFLTVGDRKRATTSETAAGAPAPGSG